MSHRLQHVLHQKGYTDEKVTPEKMFNIISRQGNENLKHDEKPLHTYQSGNNKLINKNRIKCRPGRETTGTLLHCWWECIMVQPLWETVSAKLDRHLPISPSSEYLFQRIENVCSQKKLDVNVYSSSICSPQSWKQAGVPQWVNGETIL